MLLLYVHLWYYVFDINSQGMFSIYPLTGWCVSLEPIPSAKSPAHLRASIHKTRQEPHGQYRAANSPIPQIHVFVGGPGEDSNECF